MTRAAYAHDAVVILDSGGDSRAPGGAHTRPVVPQRTYAPGRAPEADRFGTWRR